MFGQNLCANSKLFLKTNILQRKFELFLVNFRVYVKYSHLRLQLCKIYNIGKYIQNFEMLNQAIFAMSM